MTFSLWLTLIPYGLILVVFVLFSFFNLFHLLRYGFWNFQSALFVLVYLFVSAALLLWTYQALANTDWSYPLYSAEGLPNIQFGPEGVLP
jgi:hypothetical protein